jgi:protein-tyrosine phosphatase
MKYMKRVALDGAHNFRDLGGIPAGPAKSTRWGCLYRSDSLAALSASDWAELAERNIRTVIDLRSENEAKASPILLPEEMEYRHYNLMKELDSQVHGAERSKETILKSMQLDYVETVFGNMECCADILRGINDGLEKGAVVFLCSAGKDRTGITAAMVLYLVGAARQDIVADYMISSTLNTDGINRLMKNFPVPEEYLAAIPDLMERVKKVLDSRPETMEALLDAFEARNFRESLKAYGFTEEMQKNLAEKISE